VNTGNGGGEVSGEELGPGDALPDFDAIRVRVADTLALRDLEVVGDREWVADGDDDGVGLVEALGVGAAVGVAVTANAAWSSVTGGSFVVHGMVCDQEVLPSGSVDRTWTPTQRSVLQVVNHAQV
jgi:hypothetical protein